MNREEFPMLNTNYIYLDNGATTWKPKCVVDKIIEYYTKYTANAHRGDYDISLKVDNEYENARDLVKEFINAKTRQEIVFTSGTTNSLNMIVDGFFRNHLEPGDEVIITESEHASNILPWYRLAKELGMYNIRVNAVAPGVVATDMMSIVTEEMKQGLLRMTPLNKMAEPTDLAGAYLYLASDLSKFTTGTIIQVDGGLVM